MPNLCPAVLEPRDSARQLGKQIVGVPSLIVVSNEKRRGRPRKTDPASHGGTLEYLDVRHDVVASLLHLED